uniref:UDP-galactose 4-epimerase n=1 Tax=uncultured prokaryote TaxID=198431 RepID=H5SM01_9ZZZZ|nr:UDP-galactose 4-epimerase [uncultured prokaryote]
MNILVTGGAGYIGSAVAEALLRAGHRVTIYDSLITGHRAALPPGAEFVHAALEDSSILNETLQRGKFDAVMHFAAFIEAGESMKEPGRFYQNNLINSLRLLEMSVQNGVQRFVLSSTAAVYRSSDEPLREDSPLAPSNVYGHTKLVVEQALAWYRRIHGLHYAALRYFNAAGALPGRGEAHRPETHLIPRVLQVALGQAEEALIFGTNYPTPDGTAIRDYVHIADLVSAHLLALEALAERPELVYNVGNGEGYSVRQVIETARRVTGHPIPAREMPPRPGDPPRLVASAEKIRRELGWQPQYPDLESIIASAWEWHRSHPHGWASS